MKNKIFTIIRKLGGARFLRSQKGDKITVLCIHRIADEFDFFFDPIKPREFELLVKYCLKHYEVVSFSEINKETKKPKLIFSFDDGYYDFIENALPILDQYNLPSNHNFVNACLNNNEVIWTQKVNDVFNYIKNNSIHTDKTINAITGNFEGNWWKYYMAFLNYLFASDRNAKDEIMNELIKKYSIESNYRMMDWDDLKLCKEKHRVEVGSHTYNHITFNEDSDTELLKVEIGESIQELEQNLNDKVNILSLPNGKHNEEVIEYAKNKGIHYVLLVNDKFNHPTDLNQSFNLMNRVYLIQEPIDGMVLRTEGLHEKLKTVF